MFILKTEIFEKIENDKHCAHILKVKNWKVHTQSWFEEEGIDGGTLVKMCESEESFAPYVNDLICYLAMGRHELQVAVRRLLSWLKDVKDVEKILLQK